MNVLKRFGFLILLLILSCSILFVFNIFVASVPDFMAIVVGVSVGLFSDAIYYKIFGRPEGKEKEDET